MLNYHWIFWYLVLVASVQIVTRPGLKMEYKFTALAIVILFAVFIGWVGTVLG